MITVKIAWKTIDNVQDKSFKDEISCIEWCRKNHENIMSINGHYTFGELLSHFDIMDILRR